MEAKIKHYLMTSRLEIWEHSPEKLGLLVKDSRVANKLNKELGQYYVGLIREHDLPAFYLTKAQVATPKIKSILGLNSHFYSKLSIADDPKKGTL